jgi:hypothetical protein
LILNVNLSQPKLTAKQLDLDGLGGRGVSDWIAIAQNGRLPSREILTQKVTIDHVAAKQ